MYLPGQEIVSIRNHPNNIFKKGEIFIVRDVTSGVCNCHDFLINTGFEVSRTSINCACAKSFENNSGIWWLSNRHFALLESMQGRAVMEECGELVEVLCDLWQR